MTTEFIGISDTPLWTQVDVNTLRRLLGTCIGNDQWLGMRCSTQAEADERVPELLRQDARRFVLLTPREAINVDISRWGCCYHYGYSGRDHEACHNECTCHLDLVIVQGGDEPMHPAWVRSIRDQCVAAGVPFYFAGWGEWCPITDLPSGYDHLYKSRRKAGHEEDQSAIDDVWGRECLVETTDVSFNGEYPGDYRVVDGHPCYLTFRVGADKSGRLLDGREWLQLPKGEVTCD